MPAAPSFVFPHNISERAHLENIFGSLETITIANAKTPVSLMLPSLLQVKLSSETKELLETFGYITRLGKKYHPVQGRSGDLITKLVQSCILVQGPGNGAAYRFILRTEQKHMIRIAAHNKARRIKK